MVQLGEKLTGWLAEKYRPWRSETFNTPRRLAVYIKDVAEKQADIQEEAKAAKKSLWMLTETGQKPLSDFQK